MYFQTLSNWIFATSVTRDLSTLISSFCRYYFKSRIVWWLWRWIAVPWLHSSILMETADWYEMFFTIGVFRKNTSRCAKLMVDLYVCDILSQIYRFFLKGVSFENVSENRLEKIINDFFRTFIIILCWYSNLLLFFHLSRYNLYMVHVSGKGLPCWLKEKKLKKILQNSSII